MMTMRFPGGGIFISHRRADATYPTGWLFDRLANHFGHGRIFRDLESIPPGDDFAAAIGEALETCAVLLVVIGPRWLEAAGPAGRRLDDPDDFVRLEIEAALARQVRIIPVLVDGARMPEAGQLPPSLAPLARRQAVGLSPDRFTSDADRLLTALDAVLSDNTVELPAQPAAGHAPQPAPAQRPDDPAPRSGRREAGGRRSRSVTLGRPGRRTALISTLAVVVACTGGAGAWVLLGAHAGHAHVGTGPVRSHLAALASPGYQPQSEAFSPDGHTLAVGTTLAGHDGPGRTYLWNLRKDRLIAVLSSRGDPGDSGTDAVTFSPDGHSLATGEGTGTTDLWNLASRTISATFADPGGQGVMSVAFDPSGRILAAGDFDGSTYLWNLTTRKLIASLHDPGPRNQVDSVAFSPDGSILAVADNNGSTYLWNPQTRHIIARLTDPVAGHDVGSISFSPDGTTMAAGDASTHGSTYLWSMTARTILATFADPGGQGVDAVAISPKNPILATGDINGSTYLWNLITRRRIATLADPGRQGVNTVTFNPSGTTLAAGDNDAKTYLWNLSSQPRAR